jgi:sugar lactone lactonase YvrE
MERVGSFALGWGESLLWDEQRQRLYFVDCATHQLLWLDPGEDVPTSLRAPSMPTGIVATDDGRIVAALDDGLQVVDPDDGTWRLVSAYPEGLGARANDLCADLDGNLITGTLNLGPAEGSTWWCSPTDGWRLLDDDISNTNGPTVGELDGAMTLIVGDTSASYYRYPYEPATGTVGPRSVFGDVADLEGGPDGATLDAAGGLWCALFGGAQLARFTTAGLDRTLPVPFSNPTDVTFGGPQLDRLYVVAVGGDGDLDGALVAIDELGPGRVEPRARLGPAA